MVNYTGGYASPRLDLGEAFKEYMMEVENYIGMKALASFKSPRKAATFSKRRRRSMLKRVDVKRAPRADYNRSNLEATDDSYECFERGQEALLDDGERNLYKHDFDAELGSSEEAWMTVMDAIEQACADVVFNTTTFTTGNGHRTDVAAAWGTASTDIKGDIQDAKEAVRQRTGMEANALIIGAGVLPFFLKNDDLINALQYTRIPGVKEQLSRLSEYFGLEKILVGKAVYNSADEGQNESISDVWSNTFASVARVAEPDSPLSTPAVGRVVIWEEDTPDAVMMEEYREEARRSTVFRARAFTDEKLIDKSFAQLLDIAA